MTQNKDYSNDPDVSGANYTSVNYSTDFGYGGSSGFQVGSTYKVFTLAEWLQEGRALNETVDGTRRAYTTFRDSCEPDGTYYGDSWDPKNDEGGNGGVYSALDATKGSINTGFAAMAQQLDLCGIRNTALRQGDRAEKSIREHVAIIKALEARDVEAAERLVRDHGIGLADHVDAYGAYLD